MEEACPISSTHAILGKQTGSVMQVQDAESSNKDVAILQRKGKPGRSPVKHGLETDRRNHKKSDQLEEARGVYDKVLSLLFRDFVQFIRIFFFFLMCMGGS